MAIRIDDFRKSLKVEFSKSLVEKIMSEYEKKDFSNLDTNNGNKLREIDLYHDDNKLSYFEDELGYFLNQVIKMDYLTSRGISLEGKTRETIVKDVRDASKVLRNSLYSRPDTLSLRSSDILNNPQKDESVHLFTLNVASSDIVTISQSLYYQLAKYNIPFDIEIPKSSKMNEGTTEAIKLHVPTMDLEDTINAINKLDLVYKNKIKKPNMFNANIQDIFGYDSLIDINGTRTSDILGVTLIKALDNTLIELTKEETIDGVSTIEYLKNASNKDAARQRVLKEVRPKYPNIYDTITANFEKIVKDEKVPLDVESIFASDLAQSELNVKFGIEEEEEIINTNEIVNVEEEVKEEPKNNTIINKIVDSEKNIKDTIVSASNVNSLLSSSFIQPAISFGNVTLEPVQEEEKKDESYESLKTDNPSVQVIEPLVKDNFVELPEPKLDTIDENIQPVLTADEVVVPEINEEATIESPVETIESDSLPGEDLYVTHGSAPVVPVEAINTAAETPVEVPEVKEEKEVDVVTALATDSVLYNNNDKETSLYEDENVSITPSEDTTNSENQTSDLNELNEVPNPEVNVTPVEEVKDEPAFKEDVVVPTSDVVIPEATDISIEDDSKVEVQSSTDTEVYKEPVETKEENIVIPDDVDKTQVIPVATEEVKNNEPKIPDLSYLNNNEDAEGIDYMMKAIEDAENNVDEKTIELSELGDNINKVAQQQTQVNEVSTASQLTQEEAVAVVDNTQAKTVDPVRQQMISKYNGVSNDLQIYDFQIKDDDYNVIQKVNGTPYTFLDYLEYNKVLDTFPLDSRVYLKDDTKADFVDGRTFIREYVLPAAVDGNKSVDEIMDRYVKSVNNINDLPKKKGLFGFMKK